MKKLVCYVSFFCLLLIFVSCDRRKQEPDITQEPDIIIEADYYSSYKLFYGEWQITELISGSKDQFDSIVGVVMQYDYDSFSVLGESFTPKYSLSLIPIIQDYQSYTSRTSVQEMGIKGDFFVYIRIYDKAQQKIISQPGSTFYVRDDNSLIISFQSVTAIAKRVGYIEDNENFYYPP